MKRIICLMLACVMVLCGCAADAELRLADFLADPEDGIHSYPFGIDIHVSDLSVLTAEHIARLSGLEGRDLEDQLNREMDRGNAVAILSATDEDNTNMTMSLLRADRLPEPILTAEGYADYTAEHMPEKLEDLECTNIQVNRTFAILGETEFPAVYVSCNFVDGSPYYLLQICFCEGGWMGGLSLTSLESPIAIQELLNHVTTSE